jgi:hypothetical protein
VGGRRRHEYALLEIAGSVERYFGMTLRVLTERGKAEEVQFGRKVMSLVTKEYGYRSNDEHDTDLCSRDSKIIESTKAPRT